MKLPIQRIPRDKYEINNWNENLIKMDLFKSFISVELHLIKDHLGASNGWTMYENTEFDLIIKGGFHYFKKIEFLDTIEYKKNLDNVWNNYVNPFYLFDIMNDEGKNYFLNYYKKDIEEIKKEDSNKIKSLNLKLKKAREIKKETIKFFGTK